MICDVGINISFSSLSTFINFFPASHMGTDSLRYQDDDHSEKVCTLSFIRYLCGDAINFQRSAALNCVWSKRCVPSLSLHNQKEKLSQNILLNLDPSPNPSELMLLYYPVLPLRHFLCLVINEVVF